VTIVFFFCKLSIIVINARKKPRCSFSSSQESLLEIHPASSKTLVNKSRAILAYMHDSDG